MFELATEVTCRRDCLDGDVRVNLPMARLFEHSVGKQADRAQKLYV